MVSASGPVRIGSATSVALHLIALATLAAHGPIRPATATQRPMAVALKPALAVERDMGKPAPSRPAPHLHSRHLPAKVSPFSPASYNAPQLTAASTPPAESSAGTAVPAPAAVAVSAPLATADPAALEIAAPAFDADYLRNPAPVYPLIARRLREQGKVVLRVLVNTAGNADDVQLRVSSGSERLDASARETVMRWKFSPARRGAQPVPAWVLVPISFSLEG